MPLNNEMKLSKGRVCLVMPLNRDQTLPLHKERRKINNFKNLKVCVDTSFTKQSVGTEYEAFSLQFSGGVFSNHGTQTMPVCIY